MNKVRAVVIDDEPKSREVLIQLIEMFCTSIQVIAEAGSIKNAVSVIDQEKPDLVFFDILLQEGDSFEILQKVQKLDFEMIFVTAFDEDSVKALKFSGAQVLLKPIQINELVEAVSKVEKDGKSLLSYQMADGVLRSQFTKIPVITPSGLEFRNTDELLYARSAAEGSELVFNDKSSLKSEKSLEDLSQVLDPSIFHKHLGALVNVNELHQSKASTKQLVFKNGLQYQA